MTEAHPNIRIARKLWAATSSADVETLYGLFARDVVWEVHAAGDLPDRAVGPDGVLDLLALSGELVDDLRSDLIDVYASDGGAVMRFRIRARRGERRLDTELFLVADIADGCVHRVFTVPVDAEQYAAFWGAQRGHPDAAVAPVREKAGAP